MSYTVKEMEIEIGAGVHIDEAKAEAIKASVRFKSNIRFDFNDKTYLIEYDRVLIMMLNFEQC